MSAHVIWSAQCSLRWTDEVLDETAANVPRYRLWILRPVKQTGEYDCSAELATLSRLCRREVVSATGEECRARSAKGERSSGTLEGSLLRTARPLALHPRSSAPGAMLRSILCCLLLRGQVPSGHTIPGTQPVALRGAFLKRQASHWPWPVSEAAVSAGGSRHLVGCRARSSRAPTKISLLDRARRGRQRRPEPGEVREAPVTF